MSVALSPGRRPQRAHKTHMNAGSNCSSEAPRANWDDCHKTGLGRPHLLNFMM